MTAPFIAACVTMRTGRDPAVNRDAAARMIREAAAAGATFVQTPEITNLADRNRPAMIAKTVPEERDETLAALREVARETKVTLHIGSLALRSQGERLANRGFLIGPDGAIIARYDKLHLFDVDVGAGERWRESAAYAPGAGAVVADLPWGRIGLSICYDLRFPDLYRALTDAGAILLSVPAAFTAPTGEAHWHVLLRARAIEAGVFVVAAAQAGRHEDGRTTYGHSLVVDPWGEVLLDMGDEPGLGIAEIDLARVVAVRARIPAIRHRRAVPAPMATPA